MNLPEPNDIISCVHSTERQLELQGRQTYVRFDYVMLRHGDFSSALVALKDNPVTEMIGYCGFTQHGHLVVADHSLLELRMLKVDPNHFGEGIGTHLLAYSKAVAKDQEKTVVLKPQRPGEGLIAEYRDRNYPLDTGQLRAMYIRHGFREFSAEEIDYYAISLDDERMTSDLWFEGIDPKTREPIGTRRYSMSREDYSRFDHIPFDEKLALWEKVLVQRHGNAQAMEFSRNLHRKIVQEHLIEQKQV